MMFAFFTGAMPRSFARRAAAVSTRTASGAGWPKQQVTDFAFNWGSAGRSFGCDRDIDPLVLYQNLHARLVLVREQKSDDGRAEHHREKSQQDESFTAKHRAGSVAQTYRITAEPCRQLALHNS